MCWPDDKPKGGKANSPRQKEMLQIFGHYFGDYPFPEDGYKLIEVPYSGMEHQTAVTYGNHFTNGYLGRDWAGSGLSLRFDFIIIHESAHEWFGNSVTGCRPVGYVDSRGLCDVHGEPVRRIALGSSRRSEVSQWIEAEGEEPGARCLRAGRSTARRR